MDYFEEAPENVIGALVHKEQGNLLQLVSRKPEGILDEEGGWVIKVTPKQILFNTKSVKYVNR